MQRSLGLKKLLAISAWMTNTTICQRRTTGVEVEQANGGIYRGGRRNRLLDRLREIGWQQEGRRNMCGQRETMRWRMSVKKENIREPYVTVERNSGFGPKCRDSEQSRVN